jgi:hypothetical protein
VAKDRWQDLERLAQLHTDGALSDEEFHELKRQVISGGRAHRRWMAWSAAGVLLIVAAAILVALRQGDDAGSAQSTVSAPTDRTIAPTADDSAAPTSRAPTAPPPSSTLPPTVAEVPSTRDGFAPDDEDVDALRDELRARVMFVEATFAGNDLAAVAEFGTTDWRTTDLDSGDEIECVLRRYHSEIGSDYVARVDAQIDRLFEDFGYRGVAAGLDGHVERIVQELDRPLIRVNQAVMSYSILVCGGIDEVRARQVAGL